MERDASWSSHYIAELDSFSELNDESKKEIAPISIDLLLPDDLLERILTYLPIPSILRASSVCKRWHEIISSKRFLWNFTLVSPKKPWYFMFTHSNEPIGYAYDPILKKWYSIDLPCIKASNWFITSSCGLVCFMDNDTRSELYVCNLITRRAKALNGPPGPKSPDYTTLAISVDKVSHDYTISIVKSKQVPGNFYQWNLSIHVYDSQTATWTIALTEELMGWRAGDESVICDGVLYFLIYSTGGGGTRSRHGLIMFDLVSPSTQSNHGVLMRSFVAVPCPLTCGRLMNLKEKLVMVGGIGKHDRPDIIKGIGIWSLNGREWQEIAKMPHKLFQGFGEFDDVFASGGTDELIYIQSYGAPALLVYDVNRRQWKWSQKCPVTKRFPLQLFTGFCFEPRLEISP